MGLKKKILIVEDEGLVALDLEEQIKAQGYAVVGVASTGAEAVALANGLAPDLIIMDVTLQGQIDGIEAVREIKKHCNPLIIFVTAHSDLATIEKINALGCAGFLAKPLKTHDLRSAIAKAFAPI